MADTYTHTHTAYVVSDFEMFVCSSFLNTDAIEALGVHVWVEIATVMGTFLMT